MSLLAMGSLVLLAGLAQLGVVPALFLDRFAAPVLPVALLAAWAATRGAGPTWVWLLPFPLLLGAVSEQRAAWFLVALLPTPVLAAAAVQLLPRRSLGAATAAAGGALCYLVLLALVSGRPRLVLDEAEAMAVAAVLTGLAGAGLALMLVPLRPRERGLFH